MVQESKKSAMRVPRTSLPSYVFFAVGGDVQGCIGGRTLISAR